jgi:CRISPR type III-A-associated protein Csm2
MDDVQPEVKPDAEPEAEAPKPAVAAPAAEAAADTPPVEALKLDVSKLFTGRPEGRPEGRPQGQKQQGQPRPDRPPRPGAEKREARSSEPRSAESRGGERRGPERGGDRGPREGRPGGRPFEMAPEIELEKLIADSLYLDNQAHAVVARMRDMDSGTKSQLRRLYNAVRRAVRAPENERQHHFVMLRARLAYTIARHSLRSLDALERLLLQVTRRNDARGYERFKDLFEAIVAYNE